MYLVSLHTCFVYTHTDTECVLVNHQTWSMIGVNLVVGAALFKLVQGIPGDFYLSLSFDVVRTVLFSYLSRSLILARTVP